MTVDDKHACRLAVHAFKAESTDRWKHQIAFVVNGAESILLGSTEGTPSENWPPSPPLQEINRHDLGSKSAALLGVGMAGASHWSASISASETSVVADLACLVKPASASQTSAARLGSTYCLHQDANAKLVSTEQLQIEFQNRKLIVAAKTVGDFETSIELDSNTVFIGPNGTNRSQEIPTGQHRWCFEIRFAD